MFLNIWGKILLGIQILSFIFIFPSWGKEKSSRRWGWADLISTISGAILLLLAFGLLEINIKF